MKIPAIVVAGLLLAGGAPGAPPGAPGFPRLAGPYLGQQTPGHAPELFAPGVLSFGYHEHRMAISPDGAEIFYTVFDSSGARARIMGTRIRHGIWTPPAVASFSDTGMNLHPAYSPDGKRVFFTSTRPTVKNGEQRRDADIWFVERQGDSWSPPVHLGDAVNTVHNESSPSVMADGTLYFDRIEKGGSRATAILVSHLRNGGYADAGELPAPINTGHADLGPFVAPDGRYLVFYSSRLGSLGGSDLYIAFRAGDGTWRTPVTLGPTINSRYHDWAPAVTPDGRYLVFSSCRNVEPIGSEHEAYHDALRKDLGTPKTGLGTFYWVVLPSNVEPQKGTQGRGCDTSHESHEEPHQAQPEDRADPRRAGEERARRGEEESPLFAQRLGGAVQSLRVLQGGGREPLVQLLPPVPAVRVPGPAGPPT